MKNNNFYTYLPSLILQLEESGRELFESDEFEKPSPIVKVFNFSHIEVMENLF